MSAVQIRLSTIGVTLDLAETAFAELVREVDAHRSDRCDVAQVVEVLPEESRVWATASGNRERSGWSEANARPDAEALVRHLKGKHAEHFLRLLLSRPGRLFTTQEVMEAVGGDLAGPHAVAGALKAFSKPVGEANRRLPFYWWPSEGDAGAVYAVRPSDATTFEGLL